MEESERLRIQLTLQTWRGAQAPLERERLSRLRAMTDQDVQAAVVDLLSMPYPDLPERGSGLVAQQSAFRRLR